MRPCDVCGRTVWDGGHALGNPKECAKPLSRECRLTAEVRRLRSEAQKACDLIEVKSNWSYPAIVDAMIARYEAMLDPVERLIHE